MVHIGGQNLEVKNGKPVVKDLPINSKGKSHKIMIHAIKTKRIYCLKGLNKLIKEYFVDKIK